MDYDLPVLSLNQAYGPIETQKVRRLWGAKSPVIPKNLIKIAFFVNLISKREQNIIFL